VGADRPRGEADLAAGEGRTGADGLLHPADGPGPGRAAADGSRVPLTYSGLRKVLERLAQRAGARKPYLAHAWHHAFAIRMVRAGMPTLALQRLMGHSTPAVTEIYVRLAEEELGEIYDRFAGGRRKR